MDIKAEKADLRKRQEALAKELNDIISQEQALAQQKQRVIHEITMNNGEARMLNRLSDNGAKSKGKQP